MPMSKPPAPSDAAEEDEASNELNPVEARVARWNAIRSGSSCATIESRRA